MKKVLILIIFLTLLCALAACSQESNTSTAKEKAQQTDEKQESQTNTIEITDASGQKLTFEEAPTSIATLDSGVLDILQALDANLTGRPTSSGPAATKNDKITEIGNPHQPNFELIAKVNPEVLVVPISFKQYEDKMKQQGIQLVYTKANSIEDIQDSIHTFGTLLGKEKSAKKINQSISDKIDKIKNSDAPNARTLLVYGAPGTYLAALPSSLSGDLLEKAGGKNIAADFPKEEKFPQYASISPEKIIKKNPEIIMLITHGDPEGVKQAFQKEMNQNATWKNLDAVKNDRVIVLPSHLFGSNPGTKVAEALQIMQENLTEAN
ncbi:ABC transporter substrate-binding protein [Virgibacillus alimentarius]|uniref:Iron complex transport system substrate-binding protein n=1 Tax=Virgibacillus alimentarius TaxID=698769 RepID=A0ABS4SAU5_9BACI|nr:ABC transporter substrate-binding protein [Virgibacillus alimentarius]MBP2258628.1 iron complex transport system substrate-binding protein [Virgibacillus alimentarius]